MEAVFTHPEMFSYAWVLSSSLKPGVDPQKEAERLGIAGKIAQINKEYRQFYFTQGGPSDIAYQNGINTRKVMDALGLNYKYVENAQAGHSWPTWRADLEVMAPGLFK
jgi:enterochelin esterase family protein